MNPQAGPCRTIADVLEPITTAAITKKTGAHADTVRAWKRGEGAPGIQYVRPLAELTNRSVDEILAAIEETKRMAA